jgi:magnesium chelatase subunit I
VQHTNAIDSLRHHTKTVGDLKKAGYRPLPVREEMRANLLRMLALGDRMLPGIIG